MSTSMDKLVLLLRHTESRNSIYKVFIGLLKIITDKLTRQLAKGVRDKSLQESQLHLLELRLQRYHNLTTSIHNARSLIRMGEFIPDMRKLNSLLELFRAQGLVHTERKKFIEFVQVLLHALFIISDNLLFLIKNYIISNVSAAQQQQLTALSARTLYYHYVVSFAFFLVELRDGIRRWEYDHPAAVRASINATLALIRDGADAIAVAPSLRLRGYTQGILWLISGTTHNLLLWRQFK
ncbi:hypothetical protein, conserved [Angomonas deanei]|uniref:Peroxisomal biogenesis factor 11 (PEX11) n=1 Tax=Angomonas deanei TaxID=59799 RepID=A0A7G2CIN8_9TRYP|nr:hypothetical protein, conserved [Angomonas deanei]